MEFSTAVVRLMVLLTSRVNLYGHAELNHLSHLQDRDD